LPLIQRDANVAEEAQFLVSKSLAKDREQRYQTANEMLGDLRALKQRLEVQLSSGSSALTRPLTARPGSGRGAQRIETAEIAGTSQISSAQYLVGEIKQHKATVLTALLGLILAVTVIAAWYFKTSGSKSVSSSHTVTMTRLATSDRAHTAVISPDESLSRT
jgi:hypothetical protein